jgi:Low affinity iron permease
MLSRTAIGSLGWQLRPRAFPADRRPFFWQLLSYSCGQSRVPYSASAIPGVINTGTTIVTFLMVFLIQATQNRDTLALQLKLDDLILATKNASNHIVGIEEASDEEIKKAKFEVLERAG